jgi:hypothetical protein
MEKWCDARKEIGSMEDEEERIQFSREEPLAEDTWFMPLNRIAVGDVKVHLCMS